MVSPEYYLKASSLLKVGSVSWIQTYYVEDCSFHYPLVHLEGRDDRIFRGSSSSVDKVISDIRLRVERWLLVSTCLTFYLIGKLVCHVGGRRIGEQQFSKKKKG